MKLPRRKFLHLAAGAAVLPALPHIARAQAYPSRPVRIVVGNAAGGTQDVMARTIGQRLAERLGQSFYIDNRPGANANIGAQAVARAAPDGYTLFWIGPANAINATLDEKQAVKLGSEIAPVAGISRNSFMMVVNPSVPAKTVSEFIAYAKANPGKLNMASAGNGTINHLLGEMFKMMAGVDMLHVPYRGEAPAFTDLLSEQVHVYFGGLAASLAQIRAGKLRALAVTTATRLQSLPHIATVGESVSGYEATSWAGIVAPPGTPTEIIAKLNGEVNAILSEPVINSWINDLGSTPMPMTPSEFGVLLVNEVERWRKVIRVANVKAE